MRRQPQSQLVPVQKAMRAIVDPHKKMSYRDFYFSKALALMNYISFDRNVMKIVAWLTERDLRGDKLVRWIEKKHGGNPITAARWLSIQVSKKKVLYF